MKKIFNFGWGTLTVQWNDAADGDPTPSELLVYDSIGKSPWSDEGISDSEFVKALNEAPVDRDLHIRVNSRGGDVHHGTTMQNAITDWKAKNKRKVVTIIDGVAASTASWAFPCASDEVWAYKGSQVFVHDAMAFGGGNAAELRKTADNLDKTSDQIAQKYADKSGKSKKSWRDKMKDETLMTGEEAEEEGLVDKVIDGKSVRNFTPREIAEMSNHLSRVHNSTAKHGEQQPQPQKTTINKMHKKQVIAMLNLLGVKEWEGVTLTESTTEEILNKVLESTVKTKEEEATKLLQKDASAPTREQFNALQTQLNQLNELNSQAAKNRITNEIEKLVTEDRLTVKEKDAALKRALKDETYLDELKSRPAFVPGGGALRPSLELVGNSFNDIQKHIIENGSGFMKNFIGSRAENRLDRKTREEIRDRALVVANTIKKHKPMLVEMFNANAIDPGLQRQIILQDMLEAFAVMLLPLQSFSTVFSNVPLEGTDTVDVPYYPLATDAGNSWNPATGYAAMGNTSTQVRSVIVGGGGTNSGANAPAGFCCDRKWVGAAFSSYEMDRQPYLNIQKLMSQKANQLGVLIFQDFVSRVICALNFGASVKAVPAAQFSGDDIADLCEDATGLNWPVTGRALTLNHTYRTPLLKDPTFKQYLSYGSTDPLRKAVIQEAYGFEDINIVPNLSSYSPGPATNGQPAAENLVGWINWVYAALFATAPIMPTPEVRALMTRYDLVVHPVLGTTFEYRRFGNVVLDNTSEIIECSYGGGPGVQTALQRITSQ